MGEEGVGALISTIEYRVAKEDAPLFADAMRKLDNLLAEYNPAAVVVSAVIGRSHIEGT